MPLSAPQPVGAPELAPARPFLKWAGGKRQLLSQLLPHVPSHFHRYHEPFLGGGAVFFRLRPALAILSDCNQELIDTYVALQQNAEAVIAGLRSLSNDEHTFYRLRAVAPASLSLPARAARFIYMNRTCFNGLYRVNRSGQFNVPYGRYERPTICHGSNLRAVSALLAPHALRSQSFEAVESQAKRGDLVYFDPPYVPISPTANFVHYAQGGFGPERQHALAHLFERLASKGVHVLLSNADVPIVRQMYASFRCIALRARRAINCRADKRGHVGELLVVGVPARRVVRALGPV